MTKRKSKTGKSRQNNKGNDISNSSTAAAATTKKTKSKSKPKANNDKNQMPEQNKLSYGELQMLQQSVLDFLSSDQKSTELTGLTNVQRKEIHLFARQHGLKTRSRSCADDRVLTISRKEVVQQHIRLENVYLIVSPKIKETLDAAIMDLGSSKPGPAAQSSQRRQQNAKNAGGLVGTPGIPPKPRKISEQLARERRDLPIYEKRDKIFELLEMSQVLIVNGATGSGKSTQLPQYLLEYAAEWQQPVRIVVSQPRRIAAITVSGRIAEERGEYLGNTVGYIIRMESKCSSNTLLSLTTSGCLLRSLAMNGSELFANTTHLVIDEVHDRDLNTDFLLLAIKLELERNKSLKLILMSATMDLEALSTYFGNAPVLDVEGRSFHVRLFPLEQILLKTGYMTPQMRALLNDNINVEPDKLVQAYHMAHNSMENQLDIDNELIVSLLQLLLLKGPKGAVIVYLPGYQDMTRLMDQLLDTLPPGLSKIFLLHSQVDTQKQKEVFREYPNIQLKIVLSTNIGQTSITIPDLLYVIDTGRAKMKTYDTATGASQLSCVWISQADAQQRTGRVGRRKDGICYRLYSTEQFNEFTRFVIPEIMRHTLEEICLLAKIAMPQQPIEQFLSQALDPPQPTAVAQSVAKLKLLHVLHDESEGVTHLGHILAELPLDVQLGKCLVYSIYYSCLGSMIIITAYYSVRDPFVLPTERSTRNEQRKARDTFSVDGYSDSLGILQLYADYVYASKKGRREVDAFCEKHFLCHKSMDMFVSAVETLRVTVRRIIKINDIAAATKYDLNMNMVRMAMTAGLYPNIAYIERTKNGKRRFIAEGDPRVQLSRNSGMAKCFNQKTCSGLSDWLLFVEKTRTAGQVSNIAHLTLVSTLMVAMQCGKVARLEAIDPVLQLERLLAENSGSNGNLDGNEQQQQQQQPPAAPRGFVEQSVLCIDTWLRITMDTQLGKQLLRLRTNMAREFNALVSSRSQNPIHCPSVGYVEKLLELNAELSGLAAKDIII